MQQSKESKKKTNSKNKKMALDLSALTIDTQQATDGILAPSIERPAIMDIATVVSGIKSKRQIPLLGNLNKVTKIDAGCGSAAGSSAIVASEAEWSPVQLESWVKLCYTTLNDTWLAWLRASGNEVIDLDMAQISVGGVQQSLWAEFIMTQMQNAISGDIMRTILLGDTSAANYSASGYITNGTSTLDYKFLNGFYTQMATYVAGATQNLFAITKNAGASYAAQELAAGEAATILKGLWLKTPVTTRSASDAVIVVSRSIFDNFMFDLQDKNLFSKDLYDYATYMGKPIKVLDDYDANRWADTDNGTKIYKPHFAAVYSKSNLLVGFDTPNAPTMLDSWVNKDTKEMNMRMNYMLDVKIAFPNLISVAL